MLIRRISMLERGMGLGLGFGDEGEMTGWEGLME